MRVAYVLLELLSRMWSKDLVQGCSFHMPVTQRLLGEYAGLSAVHVCRTLRSFVKDGLLETGGHMDVHIKEPTRLAEIAGLDLPTIAEGLPVSQVDRMAS